MANWRSTIYTELVKEPASPYAGLFHPEGSSFKRTLDIKPKGAVTGWEFQQLAVMDFLGWSAVRYGLQGSRYVSRIVPHFYPLIDSRLLVPDANIASTASIHPLFATRVESLEPIGHNGANTKVSFLSEIDEDGFLVPTDTANYTNARMTLRYETLPYEARSDDWMKNPRYPNGQLYGGLNQFVDARGNPDESTLQRYVTKKVDPQGRAIHLPEGFMRYVGGAFPGHVVPFGVPKIERSFDVTLTWEQVPESAIPFQVLNPDSQVPGPHAIDTMIGKVNRYHFPYRHDSSGIPIAPWPNTPYFPAGTLLLQSAVVTPLRNAFGLRVFRVEYHFSYLPLEARDSFGQVYLRGHNLLLFLQQIGHLGVLSVSAVNTGGTGYTVNDVLTLSGGSATIAATLKVNTVASGVVTSVSVLSFGDYQTAPPDPVSVTGGTGTGATFRIVWGGPGPKYGYGEISSDGFSHPLNEDGVHTYDAGDFRALFRVPGQV